MIEVDSEGKSKAVGTMLKFLTHKLRTHSINEDPNQEKTDDDHDSGTESDDEFQNSTETNRPNTPMESPPSPTAIESALPSDTDFCAPVFTFVRAPSENPLEDMNIKVNRSSPAATIINTTICQSRESELLLLNYNNDQHSSEEELEVINSPKVIASQGCRPATAPEKRKWSQVSSGNGAQSSHCSQLHQSSLSTSSLLSQQQQQQQQQHQQQGKQTTQQTQGSDNNVGIVATCSAPVSRAGREAPGSGSSDEEIQGLLSCDNGSVSAHSQPVQFHTSPPVNAHKPGRSLSPPPKLFHASTRDPRPRSRPRHHSHLYHHHHHHHQYHHHHYHHHHQIESDVDSMGTCSPRKRHRPPHRQPRPCLDFEKMQQLKARALTTWRHSGEHGGELSVFCW